MNKKLKVGSHQLDHSTPTPLYYQISQVLERMIKERRVESGGKLPSEDRLAGLFEDLQRLREVEDDPLLVSESYLPFRLFPGLLKEDFRKNSLYVTMERKCHVPVVRTERWLRVVKASEEDAYILRVSVGEPLIQLEGLAFSRDNVKVEYFNMRIRSDRAVLWTTLYRT